MFKNGSASDLMPWSAAIGLAVVLTAAGLLVVVLGRRAMAGRLTRNYLAGIRTFETLASDAAWNAAHSTAGRRLSLAGVGPLLVGPLLLLRPSNGVGLVMVLAALVWLLFWVLAAGRQAQQAARAIGD